MSHTELGAALLHAARSTLDRAFGHGNGEPARVPVLDAPGATFVTLTQHGDLRGCVGTLDAHRSLREDVTENTLSAAFHDPRFEPLAASEWPHTRIEVSLLTPPVPLPVADEQELWQRLQPGIDGVVLAWHGKRATFLPQVWERLAEPRIFVEALKRKAGMDAAFWDDDIAIARYLVTKYREPATQRWFPSR
jgi:AmmeMemoRadiSam system protein A